MTRAANKNKFVPLQVTLLYMVIAIFWLFFSDDLHLNLFGEGYQSSRFYFLKDLSYILITSFLLYWLINKNVRNIERREKAMTSSEEKYKTIFENTGTATLIIEENMCISLANSEFEKISGYKKEGVEGKLYLESFFSPERFSQVKDFHYIRRMNPALAPRNYETAILDSNGVEKRVHMTVAMIPGTKQSVASILDISEVRDAKKRAKLQQQQLIQADKMATLGILVSGVAHEINNPNNFIKLNAKIFDKTWNDAKPILQEYYDNNGDFVLAGMPYTKAADKIGQLINGLSEGSDRIERIVQSLKDYARQDTGDISQNVNINKVIESANLILHNLIKKSTDHFEKRLGQNIPEINGNPQQLEQVVINLVSNSCQALPAKNKKLTITSEFNADSSQVILKVVDEGIGIPEENMRHIMDPFFTTKRNSGGTGLGLSISYNIVKDHGGDLQVVSEKDVGTTVIVTLPVTKFDKSNNGVS